MLKIAVLTLLATPALADDFLYFHSPSGNINCALMTGDFAGVRCDMTDLTRNYQRPADCDLEFGDAFEVGPNDRKGAVLCHGDTVIDPGSKELGYGASARLGAFTCTSEKTGMTCTNGLGHGFSISKASQKLF